MMVHSCGNKLTPLERVDLPVQLMGGAKACDYRPDKTASPVAILSCCDDATCPFAMHIFFCFSTQGELMSTPSTHQAYRSTFEDFFDMTASHQGLQVLTAPTPTNIGVFEYRSRSGLLAYSAPDAHLRWYGPLPAVSVTYRLMPGTLTRSQAWGWTVSNDILDGLYIETTMRSLKSNFIHNRKPVTNG